MAAPAGPRPGWSRRAQYSLFFGFLAAVAGLVVGLLMLVLSLVAPASYSAVRGAALDVTAPITGALAKSAPPPRAWSAAPAITGTRPARTSKLKAERNDASPPADRGRGDPAGKPAAQGRAADCASAAARRSPPAGSSAPASKARAASPCCPSAAATASRRACRCAPPTGWSDGWSTPAASPAACCSSPTAPTSSRRGCCAAGCRSSPPGRGDGTVDIRPLEVGRNPFKRGDIIVTSGTGGLYPPLVPIARVVRLDDDGALGVPLADPSQASFAIVERPFEPEALAVAAAAEGDR